MGDYGDLILALAEDERWRDGAIYVMPSAMTKVESVPSRSSWNSAGNRDISAPDAPSDFRSFDMTEDICMDGL
ncbi:hypothetical protein SCP_0107720 [Sparassis crispa]|uniref:Uncharacterized protein n=1 Tax=Sparassis crispa TaxID=139825 RepID=A0A401G6U5_9APHY|nr:hypothetical protein SCP_0107720 [Sparassis crispa]GBE77890.1 hypothetical protein SCP_0107720 [Sparassis crispa]